MGWLLLWYTVNCDSRDGCGGFGGSGGSDGCDGCGGWDGASELTSFPGTKQTFLRL